ncbi:hypothetical protein SIID45300_02559 [Candidatus Magnetaquicoccaceae bacterium FCR-1]|uniref:HicB-like antitoxin of toxin-antitoxin system domain-containing protein n=1 Tax=Candidatus Magnetaquiglobus chichijimensis TaxID=3141448 RepID=A0ABQ0CBE7_9PROT
MGKRLSGREGIETLKRVGWMRDSVRGDHPPFKRPALPGKVTVPHPDKDGPLVIIQLIEKQAGMTIRQGRAMESRHDPAIMCRGSEGMRGGFSNLPGCVSLGGTVRKTATNAEEALFGPVARMIRAGDPLPDLTLMDDRDPIAPDPEDPYEVTRFLVRVELPARWIRLTLSRAETLVARIDRAAREIGMRRSGFLAGSARRMLDARM